MTVAGKITAPKLAEISDGYRIAAEVYEVATRIGCSMGLDVALWAIVEREAKNAERGP